MPEHSPASDTMKRLEQVGVTGHENFVSYNKALDYQHLQAGGLLTLGQSLGVREVQSQQTPAGPAPRGS